MKKYLASTQYINWQHPSIRSKAKQLAQGLSTKEAIAKCCFTFVRDEIKHSFDYKLNPVTCKASDVLEYETGYCYAKSHLLAALLRANSIPAGLCYQRLTIAGDKPPFCLHGLNAIFLEDYNWYRVDARGNKSGVSAEFTPPIEKLAFPTAIDGESNLQGIWAEPLPIIVELLTQSNSYLEVAEHLPDVQLTSQSH